MVMVEKDKVASIGPKFCIPSPNSRFYRQELQHIILGALAVTLRRCDNSASANVSSLARSNSLIV